MNTQTRN